MSEKLRAGIIACGRMSYAHSRAYAAMPDVELVAGADISPEALARFREEFGISEEHTYTDYVEMLEHEELDLISIASLHHQHAEMTIKAAEYQPKAILCEKPIAVSLGEADAMIAACEAAGTRLIIGHQRRYNPQYVAAYRALKGGAIGDLMSLETHGHPFSSLMVDGTHTIDLARWYADEAPIGWVLGQIDWSEARSGWPPGPAHLRRCPYRAWQRQARRSVASGDGTQLSLDPAPRHRRRDLDLGRPPH